MIFKKIDEQAKIKYTTDDEILEVTTHLNNIQFYQTPDGKCPVEDYLIELTDNKLVNNILYDMRRLNNLTYQANPPLSKYIDDGIFEMRTKSGSNITRIFYFFVFGNNIIMTNAYTKKSQEMSKLDFNLAKKYRNDYMKNQNSITEEFFITKHNITFPLNENNCHDLNGFDVCGYDYLYLYINSLSEFKTIRLYGITNPDLYVTSSLSKYILAVSTKSLNGKELTKINDACYKYNGHINPESIQICCNSSKEI